MRRADPEVEQQKSRENANSHPHQPSSKLMGRIGIVVLLVMMAACLFTLPYTFGEMEAAEGETARRRYEATNLEQTLLPPAWTAHAEDELAKIEAARERGEDATHWLGTDRLGRDFFIRCLAGGGISLLIGLAAALIAVIIGTAYGTVAGYVGGRVDSAMMRVVDILYGLPYILLVVLLAVAVDGLIERGQTAAAMSGERGLLATLGEYRNLVNIVTLLVAIGGVSWLTMARVIRGQVLSLKQQPFMEACRSIGVPWRQQFSRHLLPNLLGPIVVYATLTVPAAILSESFLSFLGIGVAEPVPSWGNLAADGLNELNTVRVRWWLLFWPCLLIAITLLALNFIGEYLRDAFDPKRRTT